MEKDPQVTIKKLCAALRDARATCLNLCENDISPVSVQLRKSAQRINAVLDEYGDEEQQLKIDIKNNVKKYKKLKEEFQDR